MSGVRFGLSAPARLAQEMRKSKFVANAANVTSEQAALEFLERVSEQSATHNCWAWRIGQRYRFNDDGEPAGTAGKPILQAIDGQSIDNVIVVVTRWFGGIKLGAGGLMRAYGGCAAECLRQADKSPLIETVRVEFSLGFAALTRLRARLSEMDGVLEAEEFHDEGALLRLSLPQAKVSELRGFLADLSRGRAEVRELDCAD